MTKKNQTQRPMLMILETKNRVKIWIKTLNHYNHRSLLITTRKINLLLRMRIVNLNSSQRGLTLMIQLMIRSNKMSPLKRHLLSTKWQALGIKIIMSLLMRMGIAQVLNYKLMEKKIRKLRKFSQRTHLSICHRGCPLPNSILRR